jgi:hypothetical protein
MKKEEIKQKIYDLYDECLDNFGQFHRKLDLFIILAELLQRIKIVPYLDVSDHWACNDNYGFYTHSNNTEILFQKLRGGRLR